MEHFRFLPLVPNGCGGHRVLDDAELFVYHHGTYIPARAWGYPGARTPLGHPALGDEGGWFDLYVDGPVDFALRGARGFDSSIYMWNVSAPADLDPFGFG